MSKRMKKPRRAGEHPKAKPTQRQVTAAYYGRRALEVLPPVPDDAPVVEEPREGPPTTEPAPGYQPAATRDLGEEGASRTQRPVLAFFYPWYAETQWTQPPMTDLPPEHYLSDDERVMLRQIAQAQGAGIDAFVSSWAGIGSDTDKNFARLLDRCPEGFFVCPYFETALIKEAGLNITQQLQQLHDRYMNHPRFFRWRDRPVVFFWAPKTIGAPQGQTSVQAWKAVRNAVDPGGTQHWNAETKDPLPWFEVFDGFHLFSAADWAAPTANDFEPLLRENVMFRQRTDGFNRRHKTARVFCAGVRPGYDDVAIRDLQRQKDPTVPAGYRRDRANGAYYTMSGRAAANAQPDGIAIVSFNEWFEGSQIEPSVTYGDEYLNLTPGIVAQYRDVSGELPTLQWPDGIRYFPETGCRLQRGFLSYWKTADNSKKLGAPVTDEIGQRIGGSDYVVQYFLGGYRLQWNTNGQEPVRLVPLGPNDWNREPQ
jgi:hypothetical protein